MVHLLRGDGYTSGSFHPFGPVARQLETFFMARICRPIDMLIKYYFSVPEQRHCALTNNPARLQHYKTNARETYRRHNAMIKRVVPKEKLLVFRLEDGWEPICEFLGKPVPENTPVPRINETERAKEMVQMYIANRFKRELREMTRRWTPVVAACVAVWLWWRM